MWRPTERSMSAGLRSAAATLYSSNLMLRGRSRSLGPAAAATAKARARAIIRFLPIIKLKSSFDDKWAFKRVANFTEKALRIAYGQRRGTILAKLTFREGIMRMKPILGALVLVPLMEAFALAQEPTADAKEGKRYLEG